MDKRRSENWLDISARWKDYERRKKEWRERNPNASHKEHEKAMREIAKRLGI